jgi:hypothetical protein
VPSRARLPDLFSLSWSPATSPLLPDATTSTPPPPSPSACSTCATILLPPVAAYSVPAPPPRRTPAYRPPSSPGHPVAVLASGPLSSHGRRCLRPLPPQAPNAQHRLGLLCRRRGAFPLPSEIYWIEACGL